MSIPRRDGAKPLNIPTYCSVGRRKSLTQIAQSPVDSNDDSSPYDEETWKKIRFTSEPGNRKESNGSNDSNLETSTFHVSCRTVR